LFFCQFDQFANAALDFNRGMQTRDAFAPWLWRECAIARLPSGVCNALGFRRGDSRLSLQIPSKNRRLACQTAAKPASFKSFRRRLSAASLSFRMPGQDCAVKV
jgi:hypothetical protein